VTLWSYRLNAELFGLDAAWGYRFVNWLVHAGSGLLLLGLVRRLGLKPLQALLLAAVWVAHPIACESVAWITARSNVLAAFFGLGGLLAYVRWHGRWQGMAGGLLGFLLALLSNPAGLGWMPVFAAVELLGGPERLAGRDSGALSSPSSTSGRLVAPVLRLIPFAALSVVFTIIGLRVGASSIVAPPGGHWYTGALTDLEVFARYLLNLLCPVRLSALYYVEEIRSPADPRVWLYGAALACAVAGSLALARSKRRAALGWLWFLGALGPSANLVAITFTMQDRYVYVASIGFWLVLVETFSGLWDRWRARAAAPAGPSRVPVGVAVAFLAFLAVLAALRSATWSDRLVLFRQAVERQPRCGLAHIYYGLALAEDAETSRGSSRFEQAQWLSREAVAQFRAARACTDSYRFHDPVRPEVLAAREAALFGDWGAVREALGRDFPPEILPPETPADEGYMKRGFLRVRRGEHVYWCARKDVAEGLALLARLDLRDALDAGTPLEQAQALVRRARGRIKQALELDPWNPEASRTQFPDAPAAEPPGPGR
jgi:hypothetical protein